MIKVKVGNDVTTEKHCLLGRCDTGEIRHIRPFKPNEGGYISPDSAKVRNLRKCVAEVGREDQAEFNVLIC